MYCSLILTCFSRCWLNMVVKQAHKSAYKPKCHNMISKPGDTDMLKFAFMIKHGCKFY